MANILLQAEPADEVEVMCSPICRQNNDVEMNPTIDTISNNDNNINCHVSVVFHASEHTPRKFVGQIAAQASQLFG